MVYRAKTITMFGYLDIEFTVKLEIWLQNRWHNLFLVQEPMT